MAIFQCQIQIIKRSEGRSAVAAAAYRAAEKIENEYTGIVEDIQEKTGWNTAKSCFLKMHLLSFVTVLYSGMLLKKVKRAKMPDSPERS